MIQRHAERLRGRIRRVTLDLDPTDDPTHGAQQLSFFNGHYDTWCYLPVMGFVSFDDEAEQYLCAAVLRPGNVTAAVGAVGILRRVIWLVRHFLPGVRIRVRLDGGFAHPDVLDFLDAEPNLEYVVAMAKNAVLKRKAKPAMRQACKLSRQSGQTKHTYSEARYAARTWPRERRVIIKAEVVCAEDKAPKDNPRFLITNQRERLKMELNAITDLQVKNTLVLTDFSACSQKALVYAVNVARTYKSKLTLLHIVPPSAADADARRGGGSTRFQQRTSPRSGAST